MLDTHLLSLLIWLPMLGGVLVLATGGDKNSAEARVLGLLTSLGVFVLSLIAYHKFNGATAQMQLVELQPWFSIGSIQASYHIGVDGISLPLILLTAFTTIIVILSAWEVIQYKAAQYIAAFLFMEGLMIGVFAALDAALFYVFWEAMLIPMFIVIGVWGGPRRVYATVKFFLYTFFGSVFMLIALIYLAAKIGNFDVLAMHQAKLTMHEQTLIFIAFLLAFAVKVPMWPVHTWLPDAHVEAPTGGSVVLAAIMLKLGAFGFLRYSMPIAPDASHALDWLMILLSLVAVVYIGFVALVQQDMKKLIAYSSISHMGFVTLGFFIIWAIASNQGGNYRGAVMGIEGGIVQMISHGFISGAMFLCVGVMYDRLHSRMIKDYGGVVNTMPTFAAFAVLFAMSNAGLPGTSGFVGEFMVILSSIKANFWYAFLAATTLILGAGYTLWMVKRVIFGAVANDHVAKLHDLNKREFLFLSILAIMVLFFGIYPAPLLDMMDSTVANLVTHVTQSKLIPGG